MKKKKKQALLLAITGGIGSGQSTVADILKKHRGTVVINADDKGREVLDRFPEMLNQLRLTFGNQIFTPDGKLDRLKLGQMVFASEPALESLNKIVHPRMMELILEEMEEAGKNQANSLVAVDAALIYELHMEHMFDYVLCIDAPLEMRVNRVMKRNGLSRKDILQRIKNQLPLEDKAAWADFVILNNSDIKHLEDSAVALLEELFPKK